MSDPTFRLALLGAGRMGRTHLAALAGSDRVRVSAIVEPVDEVRYAVAAEGVTAHRDVEDLLAAGDVDGVLIAAPTDLHVGLVETLAAAGLPILCEKPCGFRAEETSAAAVAAESADVVLQIGYWRRFVPGLQEVRRGLVDGELGVLSSLSCWQWDERPPTPGFRVRSGGILLDMGVHEFDQIRWLSGQEIEDVAAFAAETTFDQPVAGDPETVAAVARLSGGAVATVSLGRRFPDGDACWLEVMGTQGYARVPFVWGDEGTLVLRDALVAQAEAFAAAVRGGPRLGASGEDAIRAVEAAERAARSLPALQTR